MKSLLILATAATAANPIRRVVTLLEKLRTQVETDAEKETQLMKDFSCYCSSNSDSLGADISAAADKAPQTQAAIEEAEATKKRLGQELAAHKEDRASAKAAIAKATALRQEENAKYEELTSDWKQDLAALDGAIKAIEGGRAFVQTSTASSRVARVVSRATSLSSIDRDDIVQFLQAGQAPAGGSAEIVGILKQLRDEMDKDLDDAIAEEEAAQKSFDAMVAAKKKEIAAASAAIESKTERKGAVAVEIVNLKKDLSDTQRELLDNQKFLADLKESCADKDSEWETRQKTRSQEIVAINETIKVLNDDESLELFNKTLRKGESLIQITRTAASVRSQALALVHRSSSASTQALRLESALKSGKVSFEKVLQMIDDMVSTLKQEQIDDRKHLDYCRTEFDLSDDKHKAHEREIATLESTIAENEAALSQLSDELMSLRAGIKALDKMVAEATEQRKVENAEFTELAAHNNAAKGLLEFAKNRLHKFYNPAMYKAPEERELTEEERIFVANGGKLEPTPPPGGIANTGITVFTQIREHARPDDAPETFEGGYKKKGQESGSIVALIDMLVKDLATETEQAARDEKTAQRDYEHLMKDCKAKRAAHAQAVVDKRGAKADLAETLEANQEAHSQESSELEATKQYIAALHADCDFLVHNFDARQEARDSEVEGLKQAKAALSGADYQ